MRITILKCINKIVDGEYEVKEYYYEGSDELLCESTYYHREQHAYDVSYQQVDQFTVVADVADIQRDIQFEVEKYKSLIGDINRVEIMFPSLFKNESEV